MKALRSSSDQRKDAFGEAIAAIGRNVTGVQADSQQFDDLDCLFETLKRNKGSIDVLFASAGAGGEAQKIGDNTEKNFDALFNLSTRGKLFTVQKALPLFNDGGSIFMTRSIASVKGCADYSVYAGSRAALRAFARAWLNELRTVKSGLKY